jgi:hypothetical protein
VKSIVGLLTEDTTADVVPALVAPMGKLITSHDKDEDEDEDEEEKANESTTTSLINKLLEDCPCDLIPDDARPIGGTELKGVDTEEKVGPTKEDDVLTTLLGGDEQPKTEEDPLKVESSPGASRPSIDCKGCGNPVSEGEATNGYCAECTTKFQAREKKTESRDDVIHRMASFGRKTPAVPESSLKPSLTEASMLAAIGAHAPTMRMPSGNDADAEKALASTQLFEDKTAVLAAAAQPGSPMPEHRKSDGAQILSAFRRFGKV